MQVLMNWTSFLMSLTLIIDFGPSTRMSQSSHSLIWLHHPAELMNLIVPVTIPPATSPPLTGSLSTFKFKVWGFRGVKIHVRPRRNSFSSISFVTVCGKHLESAENPITYAGCTHYLSLRSYTIKQILLAGGRTCCRRTYIRLPAAARP